MRHYWQDSITKQTQLIAWALECWLTDQIIEQRVISSMGERCLCLHGLLPLSTALPLKCTGEFQMQASAASWNAQLRHLSCLRALKSAWPISIPPPLLIKGADYSYGVFDAEYRTISDWDVLIPEPYYSVVENIWKVKYGEGIIPRQPRQKTTEPSFNLGFKIEGSLIELHRALSPKVMSTLDIHSIYDRGILINLGGMRALQPHPKDRLLIFLVTFARGSGLDQMIRWVELFFILKKMSHEEGYDDLEILIQDCHTLAQKNGLQVAWQIALASLYTYLPMSLSKICPKKTFNLEFLVGQYACNFVALRSLLTCPETLKEPTSSPPLWKRKIFQFALCPPSRRGAWLAATLQQL